MDIFSSMTHTAFPPTGDLGWWCGSNITSWLSNWIYLSGFNLMNIRMMLVESYIICQWNKTEKTW